MTGGVAKESLDAMIYRQVNLYANKRFPHNLTFVRNLLHSYEQPRIADPAAWQQLIRRYWFYSDGPRSRFFEDPARNGNTEPELRALRPRRPAQTKPAGGRLWAAGG